MKRHQFAFATLLVCGIIKNGKDIAKTRANQDYYLENVIKEIKASKENIVFGMQTQYTKNKEDIDKMKYELHENMNELKSISESTAKLRES